MEAVLHDKEIEPFKALLQYAQIWKGNDGVCGDDPQRADFFGECRFDDVWIRKAARCGDATGRYVPELGQCFAVSAAFELAVAGQAGCEAGFSRPHCIALPGY